MSMPTYLYHATLKIYAQSIADNGLQPRSVGGEKTKYLCMSGTESGATTLGAQASDIIFRVKSLNLNASSWSKRGAGKQEWRSTEGIDRDFLEYRRNLGTESQKTWRPASSFPIGM
jgi:hypothetical protein